MVQSNVWTGAAALAGAVGGGALVKKLWLEKYREQASALVTAVRERDLLYTWVLLKEKGVDLAEYFIAHDLKTIAILGMNRIGRRLYDELWDHNGLGIVFGVEAESLGAVHETLTVYRLGDDPLPGADCMVVCDLYWSEKKMQTARREYSGKIVSLVEIMVWLLERHHIEPRDGAIPGWPN